MTASGSDSNRSSFSDFVTRYAKLYLSIFVTRAFEILAFVWIEIVSKDWLLSRAEEYPYHASIVAFLVSALLIFAILRLDADKDGAFPRLFYFVAGVFVAIDICSWPNPIIFSTLGIFLVFCALSFGLPFTTPSFQLLWRRIAWIIRIILCSYFLNIAARLLPPLTSISATSDFWLGRGLGTEGGNDSSMSLSALLSENGFLALANLCLLLVFAMLSCLVIQLRYEEASASRKRALLCCGGLSLLYGLLLASAHTPAFLTVNTSLGTVALFSGLMLIGISSARPFEARAISSPKSTRTARWTVALLVALLAIALVVSETTHIAISQRICHYLAGVQTKSHSFALLKSISRPMQDATIAMEDSHFYQHHGFDWIAMHRALRTDLRDGRIEQGGSTITQQLAKNLFLSNDRTLWRKIVEAAYTCELEHDLSKKRILELYLNNIDYGMGQRGIGAAAAYYFHKTPAQLTAAESACLVGMVPDPMHEQLDLQRVAEGEQTALSRMAFFFPQRYSQAAVDEAMSIPIERLMYPFKDAWDRGATETIPSSWHNVSFYFFADPDDPSDINNVSASLKPQLASFLDEARDRYHLTGIDHLGVYNDRPMRQSGTLLSAHAFGQAIDISGFRFADGSRIRVEDHTQPNVSHKLAEMESLLKKHFDIVVDWRDDPLRHQTHFHCEVRGPRSTQERDAIAPKDEVTASLSSSAPSYARYAAWSSGANVPKRHPMSCGPAALATVLSYYLHHPATEEQMMRGAGSDGNSGTGLDQLSQAAASAGVKSQVVQINTARLLQQLSASSVPVLVLVFVPDGHFVDVVGRVGDNLLISDPNSGSKVMTVSDFTKIWRGDALIIEPRS